MTTLIKKYDEEKEAECPDDTYTIEMEEGVSDRNYEKNEKKSRGKRVRIPR